MQGSHRKTKEGTSSVQLQMENERKKTETFHMYVVRMTSGVVEEQRNWLL